jgi:hypothetical protein
MDLKSLCIPGVVVHVYNPSKWEVEVVGWKVQEQPDLHSKTLSQQTKDETKRKALY